MKNRLTYWTGYDWIAVQDRINGKYPCDREIYNKLAEYENLGLTPEEIKALKDFLDFQGNQVSDLLKRNSVLISSYHEAISFISENSTCPLDEFDHDMNCEKECKVGIAKGCWWKYFKAKGEERWRD